MEDPNLEAIDHMIEELVSERQPDETPTPFTGKKRAALDQVFGQDSVEKILEELESLSLSTTTDVTISNWAKATITTLRLRSPTSLKVALHANHLGRNLTLLQALQMELGIAVAFCVCLITNISVLIFFSHVAQSGASTDFRTGVTAVLLDKKTLERPAWSPETLQDVSDTEIQQKFFSADSPFLSLAPKLTAPEHLSSTKDRNPMRFSLPTEKEIGSVVRGNHQSSSKGGIKMEELISRFEDLRPGKHGVKEKVMEVAQRKCDIVDNSDGNFQWLKWRH